MVVGVHRNPNRGHFPQFVGWCTANSGRSPSANPEPWSRDTRPTGNLPVVSLSSMVARARGTIALFGPAFVAAIAYVDPGNVATNVTAGAVYGYLLVWVVVLANGMACLVQYLSAKLGLATGMSLPESLRDRLPTSGRIA